MNNRRIWSKSDDEIITVRIDGVYGFPNKTYFKGGHGCKVGIKIKVGSYSVEGSFYTSTGELFKFYKKLKPCQNELNSIAEFDSYESSLELTVKYESGRILICGEYQENLAADDILEFNFNSNQSYFKNSVKQLEQIFDKYGGTREILTPYEEENLWAYK